MPSRAIHHGLFALPNFVRELTAATERARIVPVQPRFGAVFTRRSALRRGRSAPAPGAR